MPFFCSILLEVRTERAAPMLDRATVMKLSSARITAINRRLSSRPSIHLKALTEVFEHFQDLGTH